MAMMTVRNIPDDVHKMLRVRAAQKGCSTEAMARSILVAAVKPEKRVRLADAMSAIGRDLGLKNEDFQIFEELRSKKPADPMEFP